jgi:hypothetical protein
MFRLTGKSLALSGVAALSTASTVIAQIPILQAQPNFNCGFPNRTYIVKSLDNRAGIGIRCVKFSDGNTNNPKLAWYGEGSWGGKTYRHVGHAFNSGSNLIGYASNIYGNGENMHNNFNGNLKLEIVNSSTIRVTGAWDEQWQLVQSTNYKPLPSPKTCGAYFDQYIVSDFKGNRQGYGLRCVLRVGQKNTTWFGNGEWGGATYSQIGTHSSKGYGAGDICAPGFGSLCNTFAYNSLKLKTIPGGFNVTGALSEKWR